MHTFRITNLWLVFVISIKRNDIHTLTEVPIQCTRIHLASHLPFPQHNILWFRVSIPDWHTHYTWLLQWKNHVNTKWNHGIALQFKRYKTQNVNHVRAVCMQRPTHTHFSWLLSNPMIHSSITLHYCTQFSHDLCWRWRNGGRKSLYYFILFF